MSIYGIQETVKLIDKSNFFVIINNRIGLVELMINISGTLASKFNKVLNKSDDNTVFSDFDSYKEECERLIFVCKKEM